MCDTHEKMCECDCACPAMCSKMCVRQVSVCAELTNRSDGALGATNDSHEFLFEIQQPARNVDQSEPLILKNLQVLAPSNALPTRLTAAHL